MRIFKYSILLCCNPNICKIRISMVTMILLVIHILISFRAESQEIYESTISYLNVREGLGIKYKSVGQLKKKEKVKVIFIADEWAQVSTLDNRLKGYTQLVFLQIVKEPDIEKKETIATEKIVVSPKPKRPVVTIQKENTAQKVDKYFHISLQPIFQDQINFKFRYAIAGGLFFSIIGSVIIWVKRRISRNEISIEKNEPKFHPLTVQVALLSVIEFSFAFLFMYLILPNLTKIFGLNYGGIITLLLWFLVGIIFSLRFSTLFVKISS